MKKLFTILSLLLVITAAVQPAAQAGNKNKQKV